MHNTINSKFGPKPLIQADYMTGMAAGADSFWVADHLNSVLPPSMWQPKYVGAAKIIPKMDAHVEPWTMLGYLAGHNKLGRMTLGVAVTDVGRRNPAVTAQAAVTLQHLTRGRAILGIGTGEDVFVVGMPDEVVDQLALFRDNGLRCLVVGNMGALHPKLSKSASAMAPYLKVVRRLKKL